MQIDQKSIIIFCIYIGIVSFIAVLLTVIDKYLAISRKRRIPEYVLFAFAAMGGALAEFAAMKMIRHKTLHKSFMIGLPAIFSLHFLIVIIIELKIYNII